MGQWHADRFVPDPKKTHQPCAQCGQDMWLPASKLAEYRRCGPTCNAAWRTGVVRARDRKCETCGQAFTPRQVQLDRGGGRFCSQRCNSVGRAALQAPAVKEKAQQRLAILRAAGGVRYYSGPDNPCWKGGPQAMKARLRDSGISAARQRDYLRRNPEKAIAKNIRRRMRKSGAALPRGTIARIGTAQRWRCAICRTACRQRYHVDHIMPLARGGAHAPANLQILCRDCNLRKNAKDPIDYMRSLGRLL